MSSNANSVLWSAQQQQWLQAMGYTPYVYGELPLALEAAAASPVSPTRRLEGSVARPPQRQQVVAPAQPEFTRKVSSTGGRRVGARMPDRLMMALLRASGCAPDDVQVQALLTDTALEAVRGDASAKRALWPQLRALRKQAK